MATVTLEQISKYFGTVPAVQDLSCTIAQGEFLALLGPSGCGKTTTLLMLAGIYRPSSGVLRFDGRVVNDVPPCQRNIGMVFQSYALYPHLTVFENLAFPLRVQRQARAVIPRKVEEIAALVQIQGLLQRKPAQLSGGQQQRVALGRALVKEPDVLLFDGWRTRLRLPQIGKASHPNPLPEGEGKEGSGSISETVYEATWSTALPGKLLLNNCRATSAICVHGASTLMRGVRLPAATNAARCARLAVAGSWPNSSKRIKPYSVALPVEKKRATSNVTSAPADTPRVTQTPPFANMVRAVDKDFPPTESMIS